MTDQLQLQSLVTADGKLELKLATIEVPKPADDEVLVRIEASPINPSDLGLLFGLADMSTAVQSGTADSPVITADIPEKMLKALTARIGQSMPVGNEGGGVVVEAGASDEAQALMGKARAEHLPEIGVWQLQSIGIAKLKEYRLLYQRFAYQSIL